MPTKRNEHNENGVFQYDTIAIYPNEIKNENEKRLANATVMQHIHQHKIIARFENLISNEINYFLYSTCENR